MLKLPYVRGQSGQAIVIIAFMTIVLFGAVGLALDGANGYQQNLMAERAAGAAALAGVIMEPNQPALALTRAQAEAKHNGYVDGVNGATVTVIHGTAYGQPREQKVTVCQQVGTFFMVVFGISQFNVCRTARAGYLSPISIGQPGNQLGSTVSSLGTGSNFYFMRTEGWGTDRQQGDGLTPNPCWEYSGNFSCAGLNADVHQFNGLAGTDPFSGGPWNLPDRGGYNYLVTIPQGGGSIWVYNAIYGPDFAGSRNHCENELGNPTCATGNYYYHEEDGAGQVANPGGNPANKNRYSAMKYTIFRVPNLFYRSNDVPLTTLTVKPIDATHWNDAPPTYWNLANDIPITQEYWGTGPANQHTYHSWVNARHYGEGTTSSHVTGPLEVDDGTAKLQLWNSSFDQGPYDLQPGTYRLRVDALNYDGTNFNTAQDGHSPQQSDAHKGYAVAVSAPGQGNGNGLSNKPTDCAALGCTLGAWNDICWYTPISITGGGQYDIPIMNLTQQYRGQTIVLDFYDQGDVGGGGTVYAEIINPQTGLVAQTDAAHPIVLIDSGRFRIPTGANNGACTSGSVGPDGGEHITNAMCNYNIGFVDNTKASYISYGSGLNYNNGHWIHMEMWIPDSYTPGADTYWKLRYRATGSITATDTMTLKVGLKGSPAHLFES
jgi:hypothetical protein